MQDKCLFQDNTAYTLDEYGGTSMWWTHSVCRHGTHSAGWDGLHQCVQTSSWPHLPAAWPQLDAQISEELSNNIYRSVVKYWHTRQIIMGQAWAGITLLVSYFVMTHKVCAWFAFVTVYCTVYRQSSSGFSSLVPGWRKSVWYLAMCFQKFKCLTHSLHHHPRLSWSAQEYSLTTFIKFLNMLIWNSKWPQ